MTAGQVSDYAGAAALLDDLSKAQWPLGNRGYDAGWFRDALDDKGIQPASQVGDPATRPSGTTSAATGGADVSRSSSAASRTGDASQPATIAAQPYSSPPSPSLPPSSSGCDQRVLTSARTGTVVRLLHPRPGISATCLAGARRGALEEVAEAINPASSTGPSTRGTGETTKPAYAQQNTKYAADRTATLPWRPAARVLLREHLSRTIHRGNWT